MRCEGIKISDYIGAQLQSHQLSSTLYTVSLSVVCKSVRVTRGRNLVGCAGIYWSTHYIQTSKWILLSFHLENLKLDNYFYHFYSYSCK